MGKKNVLLLSMSTLPQVLLVQNYYFMGKSGDRKNLYGYSQLEPITRLLIRQLNDQGKKLDKIVIMTSYEALRDTTVTVKCAAVPFYLQRIREFVAKGNGADEQDQIYFERMQKEKKEWFKSSKSTTKGEFRVSRGCTEEIKSYLSKYAFSGDAATISLNDISVEIVTLYEKESETSETKGSDVQKKEEIKLFFEVIDCIKATGDDIDLYLDMQGGDRNTTAQMNAIVSLLEDQGVKTEARYAISYDRNNIEHPINEVSEKYSAYQLIGAMQSFKRYGRGQSLIDYFEMKKTSRENDEILCAIKNASDAIRLCDMDKFDIAVSQIEQIKKKRECREKEEKQTELDIVFEDIQKDYEKLFGQGKGMYIAKIKWCLEKGFLQQALTIIESKIPEYLYQRGIITVDMEKSIKGEKKENGRWVSYENTEKKVSEILELLKSSLKKGYAANEHIVIEQLSRKNASTRYEIPERIGTLEELLNQNQRLYEKKGIRVGNYSYQIVYQIPSKYITGKKENGMAHFLKLHWELKMQRNNINHSSDSDNRFPKEKLERYIKFYVELGELLEIDPK